MAIRQGDWKLVRYDTKADSNDGGRKQPTSSAKLYNLSSDIHEDKDLSAEMPEKAKELQAHWDEWNKVNVKPLWGSGSGDNDGPEPGVTKKGKKKAAK
jgi:arylsulfatase A-like enzyme